MKISRPTRVFAIYLSTLLCFAMLSGCGDGEEPGIEADLIRPPRAGDQCDRTWKGPAEDEAVAATLFLNRGIVRPGGRLWAAIENRGTTELVHGIEPKVKRRVGDEWVVQTYPRMDWILLAITIDPKTVSTCIEVPVPSVWNPGLYRVHFDVRPYDSVDDIGGPGFPSYFRVRDRYSERP